VEKRGLVKGAKLRGKIGPGGGPTGVGLVFVLEKTQGVAVCDV